ncbi:MAG: class II aldolase/adducin family protein [Clostridiaceae bacterium]|jgi:L-ribulose-5-phosphate 4-epimerase|nr:class II aldolase/adducin family protein [Clostridiaceae bacterium]
MDNKELREKVVATGVRLLAANLVQGTWGNLSARVDEFHMLITPSGIDYRVLKPEELVLMDMRDLSYPEGSLKPSSERGIHAGVMLARGEIGAVIHSHPNACSVFAAAHTPFIFKDAETAALFNAEKISVAAYGLPSTKALVKHTVAGIGTANAVFMANHGIMCAGADLDAAFKLLETLENLCAAALS